MPELVDLVDEGGGLSLGAPLFTLAAMCYPKDGQAGGRFARALFGARIFEWPPFCDGYPGSNTKTIPKDMQRELWKLLKDGRYIDQELAAISDGNLSPARAGPMAGGVLLKALQLFAHIPKVATLEKAYGRVAARAVHHKPWGNASQLKAAVARFRPAWHLWAAHVLWEISIEELSFEIDLSSFEKDLAKLPEEEAEALIKKAIDEAFEEEDILDEFQWWHENNLPYFLALAEQIRHQGQACKSTGSRGPLLREAEMLTVPASAGLPQLPPLELPPLSEADWFEFTGHQAPPGHTD